MEIHMEARCEKDVRISSLMAPKFYMKRDFLEKKNQSCLAIRDERESYRGHVCVVFSIVLLYNTNTIMI
jgi:hypothetical protein